MIGGSSEVFVRDANGDLIDAVINGSKAKCSAGSRSNHLSIIRGDAPLNCQQIVRARIGNNGRQNDRRAFGNGLIGPDIDGGRDVSHGERKGLHCGSAIIVSDSDHDGVLAVISVEMTQVEGSGWRNPTESCDR